MRLSPVQERCESCERSSVLVGGIPTLSSKKYSCIRARRRARRGEDLRHGQSVTAHAIPHTRSPARARSPCLGRRRRATVRMPIVDVVRFPCSGDAAMDAARRDMRPPRGPLQAWISCERKYSCVHSIRSPRSVLSAVRYSRQYGGSRAAHALQISPPARAAADGWSTCASTWGTRRPRPRRARGTSSRSRGPRPRARRSRSWRAATGAARGRRS